MKKLSILVIDDNPANIAKAIEQFSKKDNLTTASSFEEATKLLSSTVWNEDKKEWQPNPQKFDVILTDLFLPEDECACNYAHEPSGKEYPYGITFALLAVSMGVKMIAIVTSWSHGDNSDSFICSLKERLGNMYGGSNNGVIYMGQTKFFFCDDMHIEPGIYGPKPKNWQKVLEVLLAG